MAALRAFLDQVALIPSLARLHPLEVAGVVMGMALAEQEQMEALAVAGEEHS